jgi:hypothetical protein
MLPTQTALLAPVADPAVANDVDVPGYQQPAARAKKLALPEPSIGETSDRRDCAMPIEPGVPSACFTNSKDAADYIAGRRRNTDANTVRVTLAGSGGITLQSVGCWPYNNCDGVNDGRIPGWTCQWWDCSSGKKFWFYSYSHLITCSHWYPQNDAFANYAPNYRYYFFNRNFNSNPYVPMGNCWRVVMYTGHTQQGAGADNCTFSGATSTFKTSCGTDFKSYNSISWHYAPNNPDPA